MTTEDLPHLLPDEKELFARIANDDQAAFRLVYHHYRLRIYAFILKIVKSTYLAEEIVQDVFLKLWNKRANMTDVQHPRSYIFMMAKNALFDHLKKLARESKLHQAFEQEIDQLGVNDVQEWMDNKESEQLLEHAIQLLPPQRQKVYRLSKQGGKTYDEIAELLDISKHTVRNHMADAIKAIKDYLKEAPGGSLAFLLFICEHYRR